MARPKSNPRVELNVQYSPLPSNRIRAWVAGARILLDLLRERTSPRIPSTSEICKNKKPSPTVKDEG